MTMRGETVTETMHVRATSTRAPAVAAAAMEEAGLMVEVGLMMEAVVAPTRWWGSVYGYTPLLQRILHAW